MVGISVNAFDFKNSFYNLYSLLISFGIFLIWLFSTFKYSMSCIKDKLIGNVSNEFQDKERSFNCERERNCWREIQKVYSYPGRGKAWGVRCPPEKNPLPLP